MTDQSVFDRLVVRKKEKRGIMETALSRKELEIKARKQDILDMAAKLFASKDFHSVTVDEIAEKVGLSKGTIYLYFDNKENIFFSILIERTKSLMQALSQAVESGKPFIECLRHFIFTYLEYFQEHESFFKIMHSEKTRSSMEAHYQMHDYANESIGRFLEIVNALMFKGVEEGHLRSVDVLSMTKMLSGILNTFTYYRIFSTTDASPYEETEVILDLFLHGVQK